MDHRTIISFLLMILFAAHAATAESLYPIKVQTDIAYGTGLVRSASDSKEVVRKDLLLDAYLPQSESETSLPVLLIIHGGGFTHGDKGQPQFVDWARYFASRGFPTFSINYRLAGDNPPAKGESVRARAANAAFEDAKAAVRWIRANRAHFNINDNRIVAMGGSAGAIIAVTLGVTDPEDFAGTGGHPNESPRVQAVLDFWGWGDHVKDEFDASDPPILIVHGTLDQTVPFANAERLRDYCNAAGIPYEYHPLEGQKHGPWEAEVDGLSLKELGMRFVCERLGVKPVEEEGFRVYD